MFTKFVEAVGVEAGSVQAREIVKSSALDGTTNDQPLSALVVTDSS